METENKYNTQQGNNSQQELGLEALKRFLNERKFEIYEQQFDLANIYNRKKHTIDDNGQIRATLIPHTPEAQAQIDLSLDMISPITDEEDETTNLNCFTEYRINLPESEPLIPKFTNNTQETPDFNCEIIPNLPLKHRLEPEPQTLSAENQDEDNRIQYSWNDHSVSFPQTIGGLECPDSNITNSSSPFSKSPKGKEKAQSPSAQNDPKYVLNREDFRILKIWYDNNFELLSNLKGGNHKIPHKCIESLIKHQNLSKEEAISKIKQYISIRAKHVQHEGTPNKVIKISKSSINKSLKTPSEKQNNSRGKHDPANVLTRLKKLTINGTILNKDYIHNLIHEMTTCECHKTREACLTILLKSKNKTDCLEEFVKFGGINLLSSWLESIAFKSGIDTQRNIVKMIMDVLVLLNVSNATICRSSIGKHVNFIVRSQLEPKSRYYCRDLNIVLQAQGLVSKWKSQLQRAKKTDKQDRQLQNSSTSQEFIETTPKSSNNPDFVTLNNSLS